MRGSVCQQPTTTAVISSVKQTDKLKKTLYCCHEFSKLPGYVLTNHFRVVQQHPWASESYFIAAVRNKFNLQRSASNFTPTLNTRLHNLKLFLVVRRPTCWVIWPLRHYTGTKQETKGQGRNTKTNAPWKHFLCYHGNDSQLSTKSGVCLGCRDVPFSRGLFVHWTLQHWCQNKARQTRLLF